MLVKAKLWRLLEHNGLTVGVALLCQTHFTHILHEIDIFTSLLWVLMGNRSLEGGKPKSKTGCPKGKVVRKLVSNIGGDQRNIEKNYFSFNFFHI